MEAVAHLGLIHGAVHPEFFTGGKQVSGGANAVVAGSAEAESIGAAKSAVHGHEQQKVNVLKEGSHLFHRGFYIDGQSGDQAQLPQGAQFL